MHPLRALRSLRSNTWMPGEPPSESAGRATDWLFWAAVCLAGVLVILKAGYLAVHGSFRGIGFLSDLRSLAAVSHADLVFVTSLWVCGRGVLAAWGGPAAMGGGRVGFPDASPASDLTDFEPIGQRTPRAAAPAQRPARAARPVPPARTAGTRPLNVLVIVLESVAERWTS